jgi:hypothetical protein
MASSPKKSIWATINVPLPNLQYAMSVVPGQDKSSSTVWAAQSRSPEGVAEWTNFDELVQAEGTKDHNTALDMGTIDLKEALATQAEQSDEPLSTEQQVTEKTIGLLDTFASKRLGLLKGYRFSTNANQLTSKPDLLEMCRRLWGLLVAKQREPRQCSSSEYRDGPFLVQISHRNEACMEV